MIRTTCFLAIFSAMLFSSALTATDGNLSYVKDKTLSLDPAVVINAMAFSPDGKLLAVSGEKPEGNYECTPLPVQVWDIATGQRIRVLEGSASFVPFLEFSPDGSVLARVLHSNFRDPTLVLYDTENWEIKIQLSSVPRKIEEESEFSWGWDFPKFLPDGNLLVQADWNVLGVMNAEGQVQREYNFDSHYFALIHNVSPDFRRVFIKENKKIQKEFTEIDVTEFTVYDLETMTRTHTLQVEEQVWFSFFFDEKTLAYSVIHNNCSTPRFWNLDNGTFSMADSCLPSRDGLSIHPDGKEFAAANFTPELGSFFQILDRKTLTVRDKFEVGGIARQARFSPTGDVLAISTGIQPFHCGSPDAPPATVELWNVRSEEEDAATSDDEDTSKEEEITAADTTSSSDSSSSDDFTDLWDAFGSSKLSTNVPTTTTLNPSYPNPFNSETVISYALPTSADVRLEVFTLNGQRVAVLHEGLQAAGYHKASMDASGLASGVYLYRLTTPEGSFARKFTLLR